MKKRATKKTTSPSRQPKRRLPTLKKRLEMLVAEMVERGIRIDEASAQLEREFLREVMSRHGGNQCRAAESLRIHRNTLRRKLQVHGLI